MTHTKTVTITNQRGLHARAAAKFVQTAEKFTSKITVQHKDTSVCGKSILDLLLLAASPGSTIAITADGADAVQALVALSNLVEQKFGEE
jgi:phosphocarrier protein HPr